jgi:hypothetical protein
MVGPQQLTEARENLTEEGACALAHAIERYWQARGVTVSTRIEEVKSRSGLAFAVRSDLRLGSVPPTVEELARAPGSSRNVAA